MRNPELGRVILGLSAATFVVIFAMFVLALSIDSPKIGITRDVMATVPTQAPTPTQTATCACASTHYDGIKLHLNLKVGQTTSTIYVAKTASDPNIVTNTLYAKYEAMDDDTSYHIDWDLWEPLGDTILWTFQPIINPNMPGKYQETILVDDLHTTISYCPHNAPPNPPRIPLADDPETQTTAIVYVYNIDLDIREAAQPQNRVCRDDPRISSNARNRILIWADSNNSVEYDLIKPPNITSEVWVEIVDRNNLNPNMPHFEILDTSMKTYSYRVLEDNDNTDDTDILVRYGVDLNSDKTLTGAEIKGIYNVYGVTSEEYQESINNYAFYLLYLSDLADQLQRRFAYGAFESGSYMPTSASGTATVSADRLTHHSGASFADAGFVNIGERQYYTATATLPIYHYADNSDASELVRESGDLMDGLDSFIQSLSYESIANAYTAASGGSTRSVTFSLNKAVFQFGVDNVGLGGVGINSSAPYSGAGTITLQVTLNGSDYHISENATIDLTIHDIFDFNYFTAGWQAYYSDSSCSAAMIQNGFSKAGGSANAGQVALIEIEVDGTVDTNERIVAP